MLERHVRSSSKGDKGFWFRWLGFIVRHLSGKGLERSPLVRKTYRFLTNKLIGEDIISVDVHGQKMYVNAAFGLTLLFAGTYESERFMTTLFRRFVSSGMVVVDVGAHVGYYTLLAAAAVGDKGRVFCFEPEPSNYALLLRNIELNSFNNVVPVRQAVTDHTGVVRLFMSKDPSGHSTVCDNPQQAAISVDCTTLDDFFLGKEYPIDIIKIDVEGAEMTVFEGMRNILDKNSKLSIFTEFIPGALRISEHLPMDFLDKLTDYGFDTYLIDEKRRSLEPARPDLVMKACEGIGYVNLLCKR